MELIFYVYILASAKYGYLYVGHTDNLEKRASQHKQGAYAKAHTLKHGISRLVYFETFSNREDAKRRESILKKLARAKKFALIENTNSHWADLTT